MAVTAESLAGGSVKSPKAFRATLPTSTGAAELSPITMESVPRLSHGGREGEYLEQPEVVQSFEYRLRQNELHYFLHLMVAIC